MGIHEFTPWAVAARLFEPKGLGWYPQAIAWLSTWRSRIGLVAIIYFSLSNGVWPFDEIVVFRTVLTAAFVVLAWVGLLVLFTARPISQSMKRDCKAVMKRVLSFFASIIVILLALHIPGLNIFAALWIIPFLWRAVWLMTKYLFGAGQAHPMLAPLVTVTTSAILSIYNLSTIHTSKLSPRLDEMIVLSGLGTTVVLSLAELVALWRRGERLTAQPIEDLANR